MMSMHNGNDLKTIKQKQFVESKQMWKIQHNKSIDDFMSELKHNYSKIRKIEKLFSYQMGIVMEIKKSQRSGKKTNKNRRKFKMACNKI